MKIEILRVRRFREVFASIFRVVQEDSNLKCNICTFCEREILNDGWIIKKINSEISR